MIYPPPPPAPPPPPPAVPLPPVPPAPPLPPFAEITALVLFGFCKIFFAAIQRIPPPAPPPPPPPPHAPEEAPPPPPPHPRYRPLRRLLHLYCLDFVRSFSLRSKGYQCSNLRKG